EARKQAYYEAVLTSLEDFKEVRLFGLGPLLLARFKDFFTRFYREDRALTVRQGAWGFALGLVSTAAFYGAYAWIVLRAVLGLVTLGGVSMFLLVFKDAQGSLGSLLRQVTGLYDDHLYLTTLFEFLDRVPAVQAAGAATSGPDPRDGIRFEDVTFCYPG